MDVDPKLRLAFFLIIPVLLVVSPRMAAAENSNLYREYIGAMFNGVKFTDVPINPDVEFHFILSFAIDYTNTKYPKPTNGNFDVFWDSDNLTPEAVADIKQSYGNVKVALSIGGAKVGNKRVVFKASSVDSWVSNAVSSLTSIIQQYGLDGIDIDYENFDDPSASDVDTFVECIGLLITTLKDNDVISFASIAPFNDNQYYMQLWERYSSVIDYVNFQFYGYSSDTTKSQFLDYYDKQIANYKGGKVLASFSTDDTDPNRGLTPENGFFDACITLQKEDKLSGIFAWCADKSLKGDFANERQAQKLLAKAA